MITQKQFVDFLSEIEPSSTKDYHLDTFLSGSYKRNTAIRLRKVNGVF